jgi:hypothetical protein
MLDEPGRGRLLGGFDQRREPAGELGVPLDQRPGPLDDALIGGPVLTLWSCEYGPLPAARELAFELGLGAVELGLAA